MSKPGAGRGDAQPSDPLAQDLLMLASQLGDVERMLHAPPASASAQHDELVAATELVDWISASMASAGTGLSRALRGVHDALGQAAESTGDPGALRPLLAVTRRRLANARRLLMVAAAALAR